MNVFDRLSPFSFTWRDGVDQMNAIGLRGFGSRFVIRACRYAT